MSKHQQMEMIQRQRDRIIKERATWRSEVTSMNVKLPKASIDAIFEASKDSGDYVLYLFRFALEGAGLVWNLVEDVGHYPQVSPETSQYMMQQAIRADLRNNCTATHGGAWMNFGFSSLDGGDVPDWTVRLDMDKITLKPEESDV